MRSDVDRLKKIGHFYKLDKFQIILQQSYIIDGCDIVNKKVGQ